MLSASLKLMDLEAESENQGSWAIRAEVYGHPMSKTDPKTGYALQEEETVIPSRQTHYSRLVEKGYVSQTFSPVPDKGSLPAASIKIPFGNDKVWESSLFFT